MANYSFLTLVDNDFSKAFDMFLSCDITNISLFIYYHKVIFHTRGDTCGKFRTRLFDANFLYFKSFIF